MPSPWDALSSMGFGGRPADDSGVRKGLKRPLIKRPKKFPYDKNDPDQMYGNPQAYDRGSNVGSAMHKPLTPKDISDDDAERMGMKIKLEKLSDEELDEVMGSPMLLGKAGSSQMGSSVPGVGSGWAKNPPKDWDDEDFSKMDKAKLERIVAKLQVLKPHLTRESPLTIDPRPPDIEQVPVADPEYRIDQTDSDLERRLFLLGVGKDDGDIGHGTAPDSFVAGIGGNRLTSRGLYGLMAKESAWDLAHVKVTGYETES